MKVAVGILTRREVTERRQSCIDTWVRRLRASPNIQVVFLVGGNVDEARLVGDVLELPCKDDYASLAYKTKEFCRWALTRDFDYVFKCDDDTFVAADRFLEFNPGRRDYIGIDPMDHVHPKFGSGGAGYWLSRAAGKAVAEMNVVKVAAEAQVGAWAEDYCVYQALKGRFEFHNDQRFQAWNQPHRIPRCSNEIITVHYVQPQQMHLLQKYWGELQSMNGYAGYDRGNNSRFARQFETLQVDWMGSIGSRDGPVVLQESLSVVGDGAHHGVRASKKPAFTYMRGLDGFENFKYASLPYDLDYVPLVKAPDPLDRINMAAYVFTRKDYSFKEGVLFDRAPYRCNYRTRYAIAECADQVDSSPCGPLLIDKLRHLNRFKFAIACENLIADGYITEKLLDCFQADTLPIFTGGWLPEFLEHCVVRLDDVSSVAAIRKSLRAILAMPDDEYRERMDRIRAMRFGHELYEMFSHRSFFKTIGLDVDTTLIRFDGSLV